MTMQEKVAFLMETIPSEKEIQELRRRYLFGMLEAELLTEASQTLRASDPDSRLIEWAYDILQLHIERHGKKEQETIPMQEKVERIIALFSNPEDLQATLDAGSWNPSDKRAIQLIAHFVANDIPLASNIKIVDRVYNLLKNALLPPAVATKYFGIRGSDEERERILDKYRSYHEKKRRRKEVPVPPKREEHPLRRYIYIAGAVIAVAGLFLGGFLTAKYLYGGRADASLTPAAMESILEGGKKSVAPPVPKNNTTDEAQKALEVQLAFNRIMLQEGLETYGLREKVDFSSRLLGETLDAALPEAASSAALHRKGDGLLPHRRDLTSTRPRGALKVALEGIGRLHGLKLPLQTTEENLTLGTPLPEGFRLHARETPTGRLLYLSDGTTFYPVEVYSFVAEPTIVKYRLINYNANRHIPVISDIWHFSDIGELRMHKHFVYQKNRISPAKIITNHFLPGGETLEMVSVGKLGPNRRPRELPLVRKDYLPDARLLYRENYEIDRLDGTWRSRKIRQVWYDGGKKIYAKEAGYRE